ncbi:lipid A biosynthesis lauroyl acyltransferase [Campylobacter iguaniorum]|uniref:lysophospholipid acyltransferase family protein n=1 Tax=Campylobacter iguaniorum TaxID=1244531 RepID=UPI0007C8CC44|nr:lysophospholipid acyltransferase family protein [Campylobacter iguaniorum]ANE36352.1 lipid A biosynthesis lauroyl acyltransferase [Campylobacter iguaniorum]
MREKIEYFLVLFVIKLSKIMPSKFIYFLLEKIAILLFYILKSRRNLAITNLKNGLNLNDQEAYKIAKQTFISVSKTACESILIFNDKFDFNKMINDKDIIKQTFQNLSSNKSALIITAHFGNWEALSHYVAKIGYPQLVIAREGNNQLIETKITKPSRQKFGNILAYKHEAMSKMVKQLKNGGLIGLLPDLFAGGANSIVTNFFGNRCRTTKSVASLVLKYQIPVIAIFFKRTQNGTYDPVIKKFDFELTGDKNLDTQNIVQACNDTIESVIRESPKQWFWMHNRWKNEDLD